MHTAQAVSGRAEKATYLGDWAWKSNLSRAAFLWERGEDQTERVTSARQAPAQTLPDPGPWGLSYLLLLLPCRAASPFRGTRLCGEAPPQLEEVMSGGIGLGWVMLPPPQVRHREARTL